MTSPYSLPRAPYPTPQANGYIRRPPPVVNPFDKVSQNEVDNMLSRVTGQLRFALGFRDETTAPTPTAKPLPPAFTHLDTLGGGENDGLTETQEEGDDDSLLEDSFADVRARRVKGKARDPRDGPGLGGPTAPIELLSDSDEEVQEGLYDGLSEEEEVGEDLEGGEEGYDDGSEPGYNEAEPEEEQWDGEEEEESNQLEEDQELRSSPPQVFEILDSDEEPDAGDPSVIQGATEVAAEDEFANEPSPEYEEEEEEGGHWNTYLDPDHPYYADAVHATTGIDGFDKVVKDGYDDEEAEYHDEPCQEDAAHQQLNLHSAYAEQRLELASIYEDDQEEDVYSDQDDGLPAPVTLNRPAEPIYEVIDDDEEEDTGNAINEQFHLTHPSNTPDEAPFPEDATGMFTTFEQPVELPDVWSGAREYAEDFYTGGDFPPGALDGHDVDSSRLAPGREAIVTSLDSRPTHDFLRVPTIEAAEDMALTPPALPTPGVEDVPMFTGLEPDVVEEEEEVAEIDASPKEAIRDLSGSTVDNVDMADHEARTTPLLHDLPPHLGPTTTYSTADHKQSKSLSLLEHSSTSPALVAHERNVSPLATANGHIDWTHPPAFSVDEPSYQDPDVNISASEGTAVQDEIPGVERPSSPPPLPHTGFTPLDFGSLPPTPGFASAMETQDMQLTPQLESILQAVNQPMSQASQGVQDFFRILTDTIEAPEREAAVNEEEVKLMDEWLAGDGAVSMPPADAGVTTEILEYIVTEPVNEDVATREAVEDDVVLLEDASASADNDYEVEEPLPPKDSSLSTARDASPIQTLPTEPSTVSEGAKDVKPLPSERHPALEEGLPKETEQSQELDSTGTVDVIVPSTFLSEAPARSPVAHLLPDLDSHLKAVVTDRDVLTIPLPPFPLPDPAALTSGPLSPFLAETPPAVQLRDKGGYFTSGGSRPALSRNVSMTRVIPSSPGILEALQRQQSATLADASQDANEDNAMDVEETEEINVGTPVQDTANPAPQVLVPPAAGPGGALAEEFVNDQLVTPETTPVGTEPDQDNATGLGELSYPELSDPEEAIIDDVSDHESIASSSRSDPDVASVTPTVPQSRGHMPEDVVDGVTDGRASSAVKSPPLEPTFVPDDDDIPGLTLSGAATPHIADNSAVSQAPVTTLPLDNSVIGTSRTLSTGLEHLHGTPPQHPPLEADATEDDVSLLADPTDAPITETRVKAETVETAPNIKHSTKAATDPGPFEPIDTPVVRSDVDPSAGTTNRGSSTTDARPTSLPRPNPSMISSDAFPYYLSNPESASMLIGSDDSLADEGDSLISSSSRSSEDQRDDEAMDTDLEPGTPQSPSLQDLVPAKPNAEDVGDMLVTPPNDGDNTEYPAEYVDADADGEVDDDYALNQTTTGTVTPPTLEAAKEGTPPPSNLASTELPEPSPPTLDSIVASEEQPTAMLPLETTLVSAHDVVEVSTPPATKHTPVLTKETPKALSTAEDLSEQDKSTSMEGIAFERQLSADALSSPLSAARSVTPSSLSFISDDTDSAVPQTERSGRPSLAIQISKSDITKLNSRSLHATNKDKGKEKEPPTEDQDDSQVDNSLGDGSDEDSISSLSTLSPATRQLSPQEATTPRSYSMPEVPSVQRGNIYHQHGARKTNIVTQLPGRPVMVPPRRSALRTESSPSLQKEPSPAPSAAQPAFETSTAVETKTPTASSFSLSQPIAAARFFPTSQPTKPPMSQPTPSMHNISRAVTRSHCKFHKISVEREDDGPRVFFIVPSCALVRKDVMESEDILDHGDATVEDTLHMEAGVEDLDLSDEIKSNLRLLVGMDVLRELEIFYLPVEGVEVGRKSRPRLTERPSERLKKRESLVRAGRGALDSDIASARKRKRNVTELSISTASYSDNEGSVKGKSHPVKTPRRIVILGPRVQTSTADGKGSQSPSGASASASISVGPLGPSPSTPGTSPVQPVRAKRTKSQPHVFRDSPVDDESDSEPESETQEVSVRGLLKRKRTDDDQPHNRRKKKQQFV